MKTKDELLTNLGLSGFYTLDELKLDNKLYETVITAMEIWSNIELENYKEIINNVNQ